MECISCGPSYDYEILYRCSRCNLGYCENHISTHKCQYSQFQQQAQHSPMGRWTLDLSQLSQYYRSQQSREPTKEEYEMFLRSNPKVLTSGRESIDLFAGVLLIAFVFGFRKILDDPSSWPYIVALTIIIAPAFILHELAHKYAAIYYGKYARFTLIRQMAYLTLFFGFIGFGIAGPGATMILGKSSSEENGKFAAAGPLTNFVLACIAYLLTYLFPPTYISSIGYDLHWVFMLAMFINAFLALFNLIPYSLLDGKKIVDWNREVWIILVVINLIALIVALPLDMN